jgi:hypothetical protein
MSSLADFLMRNSAVKSGPLPLVHTTQAYNLEDIMSASAISTRQCDVFKEKLSYFFVGRPAYKKELSNEAAEWELPICFIFSYDVSNAKRIFPFDSGAYEKRMFPSFIQMMNRESFNVSSAPNAPERIIGTFFGSPANYFRLKTQDEDTFAARFSLGVFDAEIRALHRLIIKTGKPPDHSTDYKKIDDRRFTIEVQFTSDKILQKKELLAVVLPEPYFLDPKVTKYFRALGAQLISYQVHPLNPNLYYAIVYEKLYDFFRRKKFI